MSIRAVFDTNVILSATVFGGKPAECLAAARTRSITGLTCEAILLEVRNKLAVRFGYSDSKVHELMLDFARTLNIIDVPGALQGVCSDRKDDMVIECGVVGKADYIVSGDRKHLVSLGSYEGIQIVDPGAFLAVLQQPQE